MRFEVVMFLLISLFFVWVIYSCFSSAFFLSFTRWSLVVSDGISLLKSLFSISFSFVNILFSLIGFLILVNVMGNFPLFSIPSMYYYYTVSISMTLWVSLILTVFFTQLRDFVAHMLPFGAPTALMLFLPLIEVFSHIIRPFTLMIRLSTNLSSGHIMMFMFSFFSLSSFYMSVILSVVLLLLLGLELAISALQAYIFSSLTYMYIVEIV